MKDEVEILINQLRNGEVKELFINNNDFLIFRSVLVEQEDYKHFYGTAQRGGNVIYQYRESSL